MSEYPHEAVDRRNWKRLLRSLEEIVGEMQREKIYFMDVVETLQHLGQYYDPKSTHVSDEKEVIHIRCRLEMADTITIHSDDYKIDSGELYGDLTDIDAMCDLAREQFQHRILNDPDSYINFNLIDASEIEEGE